MMIARTVFMGLAAWTITACGAAPEDAGIAADAVVLDVRCSADAECPSGFECETEVEHGVDTSYCVAHDEDAASAGTCPDGFELEEEHAGTFCKPHGGSGNSGSSGGADDGSGAGGDDGGGHDGGGHG